MTDLKIEITAGYGRTLATSEDQRLVARILSMVLEAEATEQANLTPEQTAIRALEAQLEEVRSDLTMAKYHSDNLKKELDAAKPTHHDSSSTF